MSSMRRYEPDPIPPYSSGFDVVGDAWKANWQKLNDIDTEAKQNGSLLYRYIQHSFADGYAIYQIVRLTKRTATIVVATGLGDDWVLPAWGRRATIDLATATAFVQQRDALEDLFAKARTRGAK